MPVCHQPDCCYYPCFPLHGYLLDPSCSIFRFTMLSLVKTRCKDTPPLLVTR